tara:strand:+ start:119 stop:547 length:429 start_codon:yes stop_codon:yes gene_type:complete
MTIQSNTSGGNSSPQKNETNIFVYGSLRYKLPLNDALRNSTPIATVKTESKYTMYDLGAFPCIRKNGETSIVGDLYSVDDDTLARIDMIEGIPTLYQRDFIDIKGWENTEIYAYFFANEVYATPTVESGDWAYHKGYSDVSL